MNNAQTLQAKANVYAKRANRALQAGDLDAVAEYAAAEMATLRELGALQDIA